MTDDPYKTLEVSRGASQEEIQKAYKRLARKYHPDLHPDDAKAKKKFQQVQAAYEILGDPERRRSYDRYGSSQPFGGGAGQSQTWKSTSGNPMDDISRMFEEQMHGGAGGGFADMFRHFTQKGGTRRSSTGRRGAKGTDLESTLEIPFRTAVTGGQANLSVRRPSGKTESISVKIPAGIESGKKIRLRGQGQPAGAGGQPGDLLITVRVAPHPTYQRTGNHLVVRVPITLDEAILGAKVDVPTPKGTITLTVPPGSSCGRRLRVKGHGVPGKHGDGDLYAELHIVLPEEIPPKLREVAETLRAGRKADVRSDLKW